MTPHVRPTLTRTLPVLGLAVAGLFAFPTRAAAEPPAPLDKPVAATPEGVPTPAQVRKSVERGLDFLEKDAVKWRKDRECASCHHGTMTVWALSEAKSLGYAINGESLAEVVKWTK